MGSKLGSARGCAPGAALLAGLAACDHNLDAIGGYELGEPASVVFGFNTQSRLMVVMSDLPGLCRDLQDNEAASSADYWVVSAWTGSAAEVEGEYSVDAFAAVTRGGSTEEFVDGTGTVEVDEIDDKDIELFVDLSFGADRLAASLRGDACEARYFQGMED